MLQNVEFGLIRRQINDAKRDVKNLRSFLLTEGYLPEEIKQMIDDDNQAYLEKAEKVLCRWYCYGEKGKSPLWLLPWCFEKIKKFKTERKVYKYWIGRLENIASVHRVDMRVAFERWKDRYPLKKLMLEGKPYMALQYRNEENKKEMTELMEEMEEKHATIHETKTQRTFLIGKVISAQRLALDRCNFSYKFAKEKAWVRFVANTRANMRSEYNSKTSQNLEGMDWLKKRMEYLEKQNRVISVENETLRHGSTESVNLMRTAEETQIAIENLSI